MSDESKIARGEVAILDAKGEPANKGAKRWKVRATHNNRRDFAQLRDIDDFSSEMFNLVEQINGAIPTAALAVGEKMYEQFSEETSTLLEDMEHIITHRVVAELERRSLRGKLKTRWLMLKEWARGYLVELGLASPIAPKPGLEVVKNVPTVEMEDR